jgi:hypothetical protein
VSDRLPTAIGTVRFGDSPKLRDALRNPFPPELIGKIPTGGMKRDYVGHAAVTDRLLKEAPDFTYTVDHIETQNGHVVGILATMTIGGKSIQEAGGVGAKNEWGEELKLAISDFLRRGAMRFGVALDLWSREDLQAVQDSPATSPPPAEVTNTDGGEALDTPPPASSSVAGETWDAITERVKSSGEPAEDPGEGEAGSPDLPSSKVKLEHPGDIPASKELWKTANARGVTATKALKAARSLGFEVATAAELTEAQLDSVLAGAVS